MYVPTYTTSYIEVPTVASAEPMSVYDGVTYVLPSAPAPTVYRSDALTGVLNFGDTPSRIVSAVRLAAWNAQGARANDFLGRVPAGAWDVVYEGERATDSGREMFFRATDADALGRRVQVVVRVTGTADVFNFGDAAQVTGRLAEICVDDPNETGGRLVLEDGAVRR